MNIVLKKFLFILLGFLLGCLASVIIIGFGVKARVVYLYGDVAKESAEQKILQEAESAARADNTQKVIDLLEPTIEDWEPTFNKVNGYGLLITAESTLKNSKKAVFYAEKLVAFESSPSSIFYLAKAYDDAGDFKNARAAYQRILNLDFKSGKVDYEYVNERIAALDKILGMQAP